jgi:predicted lipid-binding transport protein (Tim44 family)
VPPGPEEERLANRIRLVGRLAAVRESSGADVRQVREHLTAAQTAYDRGDRNAARREVDRAHQLLESDAPEGRTA